MGPDPVSPPAAGTMLNAAVDSEYGNYSAIVRTDTSAQVKYDLNASDAGMNFKITTTGWIDTRGRND